MDETRGGVIRVVVMLDFVLFNGGGLLMIVAWAMLDKLSDSAKTSSLSLLY